MTTKMMMTTKKTMKTRIKRGESVTATVPPLLLLLGLGILTVTFSKQQQHQQHAATAFSLSIKNVPVTKRMASECSSIVCKMAKKKDWFAPDSHEGDNYDEADDDDDDDDVVTREMLHRDLLNMEPKVIRKQKRGKNGGTGGSSSSNSSKKKNNDTTKYKPLDNRDSLLFSIRNISPDPYTHPEIKNSRRQTSPRLVGKNKKTSDLEHQTSLARLYLNNSPQNDTDDGNEGSSAGNGKKGSNKKKNKATNNNKKKSTTTTTTAKIDPSTLLGEFHLDKSTTSGYVTVVVSKDMSLP